MKENMGKVVFLGSFDPPTNGHLHLISEALSNGASEVLMIPALHNPWKPYQTPYEYRLGMCKLIEPLYPGGKVKVLSVEKEISEETNLKSVPTWMVLKNLEKEIGDFKILVTNETYREIPKWVKGEDIIDGYKFMILSSFHLGRRIPGSIDIISLPISSTLVRERLGEGNPVPEYLPTPVIEYIRKYGLYKDKPGT